MVHGYNKWSHHFFNHAQQQKKRTLSSSKHQCQRYIGPPSLPFVKDLNTSSTSNFFFLLLLIVNQGICMKKVADPFAYTHIDFF